MPINEKLVVQLTEDLHGFPTFVVNYKRIRYNFCHLSDVKLLLDKVYSVKNDVLLSKQVKPKVTAVKVVTSKKRMLHISLRNFILSLVDSHTTIASKEIQNYVDVEFEGRYTKKQIQNSLTYLVIAKKIERAGYGQYKKVSTDGSTRHALEDNTTGS